MKWYDRLTTATWIDHSTGAKTPIGDLTPKEARNALAWLSRHDQGVVMAAVKALEERFESDVEVGAMMDDPRTWLINTPLVQALTERAAACIGPRPSQRTAPATSLSGVRTVPASSDTLGILIPFPGTS
ncbi:hypothetical protein [Nonomuraea maheshkhaliensis]